MAAKRARTEQSGEKKYLEFMVHIPSEPAPDIVIASSGKGFRPRYAIHPVHFNTTTTMKFSKLWLRFMDYMLYKKGEDEPFMDFEAPLTSLDARVFIAKQWTSEYERQRQHLLKLSYVDNLERLEKNIVDHEAALVEMRKRRETLLARIDDITKNLDESLPK